MVLQKYRWLNFQVLLTNIRKQEAGQPLDWMNAFIAKCTGVHSICLILENHKQ